MKFIADLHIHSSHSRDTSPEMDLQSLYKWGQIKGIYLLATGDFTHPLWFGAINEMLEEAEPGLFRLKKNLAADLYDEVPTSCKTHLRYLLTAEVTCVFTRDEKLRKIHFLIAVPSPEVAARLNSKLAEVGNIEVDGSPVIPLDARELLILVLGICPQAIFIPAHIWTPTYGILGSVAGFDSIEECFGDLSDRITALETGISSDPAMNRRWSALDNYALVSNSDAHSLGQLGREANVFMLEPSFAALKDAISARDSTRFLETIEVYPEEGKYFHDGHASCGTSLSPAQSGQAENVCPQCGKKMNEGVLSRITRFADRAAGNNIIPFRYVMPLREILADTLSLDLNDRTVGAQYLNLVAGIGSEFHILLDAPIDAIRKISGESIAGAIENARSGKVKKVPGYDGVAGKISILRDENSGQLALF
jgi:DNA helicase II / ATP-dependent DNA helicase PcrA